MNAVISGRGGLAVLLDGDAIRRIHVEAPDLTIPVLPEQLPLLLHREPDLVFLEDVTDEQVRVELDLRWRCQEALDLVLLSLDRSISLPVRAEVISELDEFLATPAARQYVERVLFAHPLPASADVHGARELAAVVSTQTSLFYDVLATHQGVIRDVRLAWDAIPTAEFNSELQRVAAEKHAVELGLFLDFARALVEGGRLDSALMNALLNAEVQKKLGRSLLTRWTSALRQPKSPQRAVLEAEPDESDLPTRRSRNKPRMRGDEAFALVLKQKESIVAAIRVGDLPRVWKLVGQLLEFHLAHSDSEHAVKSLCDLAMEASRAERPSLQLELSRRAVELKSDDGWAWDQYAAALLANGDSSAALAAYDRAGVYDLSAVAKTGRAEVLKAMNRLEEALAAYDEVSREHPENVVAKTGRAEVLKAMNRLEEALAAYDEVSREHPEDVVAKTGRAEVLKAMNRLEEALAAYDEVSREHPEDVVAKTGRAEVLKAMNRLEEALAAYDEVSREHPEDVVAKTGRAEVLKAMNRLEEALAAYDEVSREHPENVVAKTGRAEVLKAMNRLEEALAAYDEVSREHPENVVAKNGRAEVLKAMNRLEEALAAYDEVSREHPENVVARNGRAEVLKAMNRLEEALAAYDEVSREHPENVVAKNGRAEVLKAMNRLEEALAAYDEVRREHPENVVAKTGRAEVLKAMNRLEEALAAYDEVRREHPEHVSARNGQAGVLLVLGRYREALLLLPGAGAITTDDWIGYHIRAMILMQMGRMDDAIQVLSDGIRNNPRPASRDYFRAALGVAHLRQREFNRALNVLQDLESPGIGESAAVLSLHAYGELHEQSRAKAVYESLSPGVVRLSVVQELQRRYVSGESGHHDDEWVIHQEVALLLKAAA